VSTMAQMTRDWRIDWLRGLALVSIFVNHMPGNRFEHWTSRNFGFSDAAEVFVLLAGVAAAFAYFKKFEAGRAVETSWKAARRAGTLFSAHIASTLAAIVLFAVAARYLENPNVLDLIGIAPLFSDPWPGLIGIMTGGYQLGYFNILPLYVLLLVSLPAYLWLARRDVRLMLAASFALYVVAQHFKWSMPNYPEGGGWYFNPFLWQLIFAIGLSMGILRLRGKSVPYHPIAFALALAYIAFAAVWMVWSLGGHVTHGLVPGWMDTLHKSYLPPPRLLHVLALAYVLVHSRAWATLTVISARDPLLTRLGRNALPVFVTGSLASMVGYLTLVHTGPNLTLELLLTVAGVLLMWTVASVSELGVTRLASQVRAIGMLKPGFRPARDTNEPTTVRTQR
jgi:hypothetical protein